MSQRLYRTGRHSVVAGYDRPLRRFFLTVDDREIAAAAASADDRLADDPPSDPAERAALEAASAQDCVVYSYLADPTLRGGDMQLAQVEDTLARLGVPMPDSLLLDLAEDEALGRGNVFEHYGDIS